jgi:hypothetical protein
MRKYPALLGLYSIPRSVQTDDRSIYVAPLAAGGQTFVVERVDDTWQVTGTTGVVWIS